MSHVVLVLCHVHTYCFIRLMWILYFMHSRKKMFWMSIVLVVVFSVPVHATTSCQILNFKDNNGKCQPCPSHCKNCVSGINCTECEDNYWGLTCQTLCTHPCPKHCHKEYGHCTYGCRDGTFDQQDLGKCTNCTPNCEICSSAKECIRCKPRFYGSDCRSCHNTCVGNICTMTTGACFACREGYFSKVGICQKCPDGCVSCNDAKNCTTCDIGFYGSYNGECFLGCRNTEPTSQFLADDEDRCSVQKGLMSHNKNVCENVASDQTYTCSEKRYCLTNKTCSSDDSCVLNEDDKNSADVCLKVISEVCSANCQPPTRPHQENANNYLCSRTCTVENVGNATYGQVCFDKNTSDSSNNISIVSSLSTIDVQCFPGLDGNSVFPGWRVTAIVFIIVSGLLVLMLIKIRYMHHIASRMPKLQSHAVECYDRGSASYDVVNGTARRHPQPLEESRNVYQHAFPHLIIRRDSMYDHAAPVDDASQLEVRVDVVEGTDDPFYDHVALADNARQWMIGVDSNEGTADSLHDISQQFPAKARDIPDNDTFLADGHEKAEGQAIYTECE